MSALLRPAVPVMMVLLLSSCDVRVSEKGLSMNVASGRASDTWTRTYELARGGQLAIVNFNGPITVTASTGTTVEVKVEREARGGSDEVAKARLAESPVLETAAPTSVKVEVRNPDGGGAMTSSVTIALPPGLEASFTTDNGPIRLEQVDGRLSASTSNGGVNGNGLSGSITASTLNGGIRVGMRTISDALDLTAVNGGIEVLVPASAQASIKATALNGRVFVDKDLKLVADGNAEGGAARQRVEGSLNGGGPLVTAQSTNGGVRVSLARDQAAR